MYELEKSSCWNVGLGVGDEEVVGRRFNRCDVLVIDRDEELVLFLAFGLEDIEEGVGSDGFDPSGEGSGVFEFGNLSKDFDEDFLCGVFGIGLDGQVSEAGAHDEASVLVV